MSIIKMYATAAASTTLVSASIDIQKDGLIYCVTLGVSAAEAGAVSLSGNAIGELSFASVPSFTTHDVRSSICQVAAQFMGFTTTPGLGLPSVPLCVLSAVEIPVAAGERIFLHLQNNISTLDGSTAIAYLFIRDGLDRTPIRRRA
ncbi:MAG: hypothetical protein Q7R81_08015 [Candidatus Peregrinibacteria bacterium]|nr:hypothetical protein [Candidatus Peregrinibacteria bacterium]